ncbi:MAG: hypothetical protein Q8J92_11560, partial [Parvibaculum sp.]|nr:hypothetical protein [Parvibaculum sp.]
LAGFYALVGRFIYDMSRRKGTLYVLTDRRVLILSGLRWRFCRSRTLTETSWIASRKHRSGRMTIWFGPRPLLYRLFSDSRPGDGLGLYFFEFLEAPRVAGLVSIRFGWFIFERIEGGETVYSLVEEARQKARA